MIKENSEMVKLVIGLHYGNPKMVKPKVGSYHRCLSSD